MSYRTIIQILLILAIISTLCICVMKPKMHKSVLVYNSDYTIAPTQESEIEEEKIPVMEMVAGPVNETNKVVNVVEYETSNYVMPQVEQEKVQTPSVAKVVTSIIPTKKTEPKYEVQKTETKIPKVETSKNSTKVAAPIDVQKIVDNNKNMQTTKKTEPTVVSEPVKTVSEPVKAVVPVKTVSAPKPVAAPVKTVSKPAPAPKVLTAQEEEIAWNVWRSNLQNQIMRDVKLPTIPQGTKFNYTFKVDKYGKITEVKTYATPSSYTPYAIQYIAPVIRSYQGRSILNYPAGTQRTIVEAYGAWKISTSSKYSTPQDYNDVEKVIK